MPIFVFGGGREGICRDRPPSRDSARGTEDVLGHVVDDLLGAWPPARTLVPAD